MPYTIAFILHASKVMLKIPQTRLQQYINQECSSWIYKRQKNQRSNCQHSLDHRKSKTIPEKNLLKIVHVLKRKIIIKKKNFVKVSDSLLQPLGLHSPWNSPGQNSGVDSHSLLQGIFPTQESNQGLLHCSWILYQLSHKGSPRILQWVAYPFSS